ncbi:MAG: phosphotransferase [Pseudomonadota bacterium]
MSDRARARVAFLQSAGWGQAACSALAADASTRRYFRLQDAMKGRAIFMDAPFERPPKPLAPPYITPEPEPFLAIARYLTEIGLSAPQIYAEDRAAGFLLLEDLGDDLFTHTVEIKPQAEETLYAAAVTMLADLARQTPPKGLAPPYDLATYQFESALALEWYAPHCSDAAYAAFSEALAEALPTNGPKALVLRDVHAENLLWLPNRAAPQNVGLLDFQDGLIGHPAYDLVSLLEDARRDTSEALRDKMISHYLALTGFEREPFLRAYATLGAQRNLKILGIFARLARRDSKPKYLAHLPRVWGHLMRDLAHPALADLRAVVLDCLPKPSPAHIASFQPADG